MSRLSLNQKFSYIFGAIYLVVGIVGFFVTGTADFAVKHTGKNLIIFQLNPLHNIVHIAIGVALLLAARNAIMSRTVNATIGSIYLVVGIIGLFTANSTNSLNILALNQPDNGLHIATAILALGVVFAEKPAASPNA
jgi:hypothetical protein